MADTIKAVYLESIDHMVKASEELPAKRSNLFLIGVIFAAVLISALESGRGQKGDWVWRLVVPSLIYFALMWLLFYCRPIRRWQMRRYWRRNLHEKPLEVEWTFSEADVIQRAKSGYGNCYANCVGTF